ncbi:MAG TPA: acyl-CoA dehydrogenase, partial [Chryseosolibacter sp.]|nr:acyl-CoA dehydrogenase [Chryseosolibacter sp.]
LIHRQRWFAMFIPERFGGLGWTLPKVLRMEEALSWADGSTGWVVTLCGGAGWFSGFLPPELLKEILSVDRLCIAGSGAVTGIANSTPAGYEITGSWKYASGSLHATAFTANCFIRKDGESLYNDDRSEMVGAFLFRRGEVTLHRHWESLGMVATASHSFEVQALTVPEARRFTIDGKHSVLQDAVFKYPFLQLAETTLSINLSGMAMRFLDLCGPIFEERMKRRNIGVKGPQLQELLVKATEEMDRYRHDFYSYADLSWEKCAGGDALSRQVWDQVSKASYSLAHNALRIVDGLYPFCGLMAADTREEINRVWRNIHTASQHALFTMR